MTSVRTVCERGSKWLLGVVVVATLVGAAANARLTVAEEKSFQQQIMDAMRAPRLARCAHSIDPTGCGGTGVDHREANKPRIDLEIPFANASADIDPSARAALSAPSGRLGKPD